MPKLQELKARYKDAGLKRVAIHMPRYEADTDLETVKATIAEHCIDDVCAIDNEHKLKDAFLNEQGWVPVYYLFDAEGKLKSPRRRRIRHRRARDHTRENVSRERRSSSLSKTIHAEART